MFESDDNISEPDMATASIKSYLNPCMEHPQYLLFRDEMLSVFNETIHLVGRFYPFGFGRMCNTCEGTNYSGAQCYESHHVYTNILHFDADLMYDSRKYFCHFCECFLFNAEFAVEMTCDTCKLEVNIQDAQEYAISNAISYILAVDE